MHTIITQHAIDRFHERFPEITINLRDALKNAVEFGATTKRTKNYSTPNIMSSSSSNDLMFYARS